MMEQAAAEGKGSSAIRGFMYAMLLGFAFITLLTACSLADNKDAGHLHGSELWETTASGEVLPQFLEDHTDLSNRLYGEVHAHAHIMQGINCYCGCMEGTTVDEPHDSLLRCYWAEHPADDGSVTWTDHSTTCGMCKKEMEDVIAFKQQGKTDDEIRELIDASYKPQY